MAKGWNEVVWNEVVMERSNRIPLLDMLSKFWLLLNVDFSFGMPVPGLT